LFAAHSLRLCLFIPLSTYPNHCKTFHPPAKSEGMDWSSTNAALAALYTARPMVRVAHSTLDTARPMVRVARDAWYMKVLGHHIDSILGEFEDMLRQEMSKSSTPECLMPIRGLGSTTKPYDCQDPGLGQGSEESDQQLNTTPFRSTIEKCKQRPLRACHTC